MKKQYVLNQRKHAERIINDDIYTFNNSYIYEDLTIITNYYYQVMQYRRPTIKELVNELARKRYDGYNDKTAAMIDKIVDKTGKYPLVQADNIIITKGEMQTIKSLRDKTLERLAFTLLCVAKYQLLLNPDYAGWCNAAEQEIMSLAKIKNSKSKDYQDITVGSIYLGRLYQAGLIRFNHNHNTDNIQVLFIDNDSEPELKITDFRELGYQYNLYRGHNFFKCEGCGITVKKYKNNDKAGLCQACLLRSQLKIGVCIDCGKVYANGKYAGSRSVRCPDCQARRNREKVKQWKAEQKKNSY